MNNIPIKKSLKGRLYLGFFLLCFSFSVLLITSNYQNSVIIDDTIFQNRNYDETYNSIKSSDSSCAYIYYEDFTNDTWELSETSGTIKSKAFPSDDSYVDGNYPNTNYGSDEKLIIRCYYSGWSFYERRVFLGFNDDPSADYLCGEDSNYYIFLQLESGEIWNQNNRRDIHSTGNFDENSITWNNKPSIGSFLAKEHSWDIDANLGTSSFIDVQNLLIKLNNPDPSVGASIFRYYSKETSRKPYLYTLHPKEYHNPSEDSHYYQTDTSEAIGIKSPQFSNRTVHLGDAITVDLITDQDDAQIKLLKNGSTVKILPLLQSNTDDTRQTINVPIYESITFDQIKIVSNLTAREYLKLYEIKIKDTTPPTWDPEPPDQLYNEFSQSFSYDVDAIDRSGISSFWVNDTSNFNIDSTTGILSDNGRLSVGDYWLQISVNDTCGNIRSKNIKIIVRDTLPPTWQPEPQDMTLEFGEMFYYDIEAYDPSGIDEFWIGDTSYFQIDSTTGEITDKGLLSVGEYPLRIFVRDIYGNINITSIIIMVEDTTAPEWDPKPQDKVIEYGCEFYYDVNVSDNFNIGQFWINDTTNFQINSSTGEITNIGLLSVGNYHLKISVNDFYGNINSSNITIKVQDNVAPKWEPTPQNRTFEFGEDFYYNIDVYDLSEIDEFWIGDTPYFQIDSTTGEITDKGLLSVGEYYLQIYVNDTYGNTNSMEITIFVQDTIAPVWDPKPKNQEIEFGENFYYDINATDLSNVDQYSINDTENFQINTTTGELTYKEFLVPGEYWIQINVNDTYGNTNTSIIVIKVTSLEISPNIPGYSLVPFISTVIIAFNMSIIFVWKRSSKNLD
mgnify:CR=1 FL=1